MLSPRDRLSISIFRRALIRSPPVYWLSCASIFSRGVRASRPLGRCRPTLREIVHHFYGAGMKPAIITSRQRGAGLVALLAFLPMPKSSGRPVVRSAGQALRRRVASSEAP